MWGEEGEDAANRGPRKRVGGFFLLLFDGPERLLCLFLFLARLALARTAAGHEEEQNGHDGHDQEGLAVHLAAVAALVGKGERKE